MRIVFFGTPELALPSLAAVAQRHEVAAVVCQPDRPQGRSKQPVPPPTKVWAEEHGIPVHQPVKLNDGAFQAWIEAERPDVSVLVAYGRILKQPILGVPPHGFINMHPSLLPRHRGPSPIQTAILEGDTVTGITIMRLDAGTDTGDILLQEEMPIGPDDTTDSLSERLAKAGAGLLVEGLDRIATGAAVFTPQDHERATVTYRFDKAMGRVDWTQPATRIHNLVRAAYPWPMAQCELRGNVCKIHRSAVVPEETDASPGTVARVEKDRMLVATGKGLLAIVEFQPPGKRAMAVADFLRGHPMGAGERFE
ncbi:MAG TPA: methionyl-tRNA formyltransferase [Candidatus Hydrogenedentes bacterium]|nr:methionyl-tRNA formyltransferase [Candidatus Hydrogenedentota bacterium]HPG66552.1 methionyl-tRNA formyltransferase [Candidatus Hydrogenedentota bacterium]